MTISRATLVTVIDAARRGLEGSVFEQHSLFHGFPTGTCGPAAEVLGRIVKEKLDLDGVYVCSKGHPQLDFEQTHAWYEVGDFILDLTHDQFEETGLTGWVFEREGGWHSQFSDQERRSGFCSPIGWTCYPHDGYRAAVKEQA